MTRNVRLCLDMVENSLVEVEHLENLVEVFTLGFQNDTNLGKDYEISSLYAIEMILERLKNEHLLSLLDLLEKIEPASIKIE